MAASVCSSSKVWLQCCINVTSNNVKTITETRLRFAWISFLLTNYIGLHEDYFSSRNKDYSFTSSTFCFGLPSIKSGWVVYLTYTNNSSIMSSHGKGNKHSSASTARGSPGSSSKPRSHSGTEAEVAAAGSSSRARSSAQTKSWPTRPSAQPARCTECKKVLSSRGNLTRHMRMTHGGPRIYCEFPGCGNSFGQSHDYKRHKSRKHGGQKWMRSM